MDNIICERSDNADRNYQEVLRRDPRRALIIKGYKEDDVINVSLLSLCCMVGTFTASPWLTFYGLLSLKSKFLYNLITKDIVFDIFTCYHCSFSLKTSFLPDIQALQKKPMVLYGRKILSFLIWFGFQGAHWSFQCCLLNLSNKSHYLAVSSTIC